MNRTPFLSARRFGTAALLAVGLLSIGCKKKEAPVEGQSAAATAANAKSSIQNIGSDTMVNLAQAWAEEYGKQHPNVSVEVSGGGSGIGIAALINGTADIANASRHIEDEEKEKAKKAGKNPDEFKEFKVGYDALSVFVHKDNPLQEISLEELAELYKEGGKISKWSELGVKSIPGSKGDEIVRVSRQNNSGTYHYFREAVLKKQDFKAGSLDMNGSKDVVELIAKTPNAIGYSGMGYATGEVKALKVSKKKGEPAVAPTLETALDKSYPIARPMFFYTPEAPTGAVKAYIDWVLSEAGQKIVQQTGYVPVEKK